MKTKELTKKGLVMLTMMFALVMNAEGQPKQVVEFQTVMSMHETTYKNYIKDGKYKEAIAPLTTLINLIDTTNIYKVANISFAASNYKKVYGYKRNEYQIRTTKKLSRGRKSDS